MCTRLSDKYIVPFIGIYSTLEHPFALVFEFMEHRNLREYLRNNRDAGRVELVRSSLPSHPVDDLVSRHQLLGIARAIKAMHNINVIHGNLGIVRTFLCPRFSTCSRSFRLTSLLTLVDTFVLPASEQLLLHLSRRERMSIGSTMVLHPN